MNTFKLIKSIFVVYLILTSSGRAAEQNDYQNNTVLLEEAINESCEDCVVEGKWQFGLAIGVGYISTPIADEDDTILPVIPRFSFYGDKFFIDNFTLGYELWNDESQRLDLIGEFNQDFLHFETASDIQKAFASFTRLSGQIVTINVGDYELSPRHATYLVGPSYQFQNENFSFALKYGVDAFNVNGGSEGTIEIGQQFVSGDWYFEHRLGLSWKSKEIVDYYYGLAPEESPALIAQYQANESANNPFYRINTHYIINDDWRFLLSYKTEKLDEVITKSNIVNEESVDSVFVGVGYEF